MDFEPEHAGKLNFYIKAVAEYALSDIHKPMGIAEYKLTHILPQELQKNLPSIEDLEAELGLLQGDE